MSNPLSKLWEVISFKAKRQAKKQKLRRDNYEFLKTEISKRHFAGFAGLIVNFKGKTFDIEDMFVFKAPMYGIAKNQDGHWCIFWDRKKLAEEIGVGAPLREGEVLADAATKDEGRIWKQIDTDKIDEQKPLIKKEPTQDSA